MESLEQLSSLKCPLCNKSLANKEYKQAITQLEEQLQKNFDQKNEFISSNFPVFWHLAYPLNFRIFCILIFLKFQLDPPERYLCSEQ